MDEMEQQIERIENKLQLLLKERNAAEKEIQRLQKENKRLTDLVALYDEQTKEKNQKAEIGKLNSPGLSTHSKKDLEKRIDTYLKDIDKCLALLNS